MPEEARRPAPQGLVLTLFACSGSAAILQEVGWSDLLARFLGHGTAAISVVTAVFLAGLAWGASRGGVWASRGVRPLRLYGFFELGIAVGAAILVWGGGRGLSRLQGLLPPPQGLLLDTAVAGLIAALVLLPLTFLMGATLPLLVRSRAGGAVAAGVAAGRLNGVNALGGAAGAVAALFLLPRWGTGLSLQAAALVQAVAGVTALAWDRRFGVLPPAQEATPVDLHRLRGHHEQPIARPLLFMAGCAALFCQLAWTRAFSWMLGSSVYTFALVLATTVGGLGLGNWLGGRLTRLTTRPRRLFCRLELALALAVLASTAAFTLLPVAVAWLSALMPHRPVAFQASGLLTVGLLLLPPTLLMGAAFPAACRLAARRQGVGKGVGSTMAWLTVGNVCGALAAGLVLPAVLGTRGTLLAAALLFAIVAWLATPRPARLAAPGVLATGLCLWITPGWDPALMSANPAALGPSFLAASRASHESLEQVMRSRGGLLFAREGRDALVTVRRLPGGHASLQVNGRTEASTGNDLPSQMLAAHIPMLHVKNLRTALVVGLASGVTAGAVLTRQPEGVVVAEIAPTVIAAARSGPFDDASGEPWKDPRVRLVPADARILLSRDPQRYDLITSQPSHPWVAGVASLYTMEFYQLVGRRLQPGGVFGQWVQGYGLGLEDLRQVLRTFAAAFPYTLLYEEAVGGGDYFLVGSAKPLPHRAADLMPQLPAAVRSAMQRAGVTDPGALFARRLLDAEGIRAFAGDGPLLRDDRLRLAYTTPLSRHQATVASQSRALEAHRRPLLATNFLADLESASARSLAASLSAAESLRREDRRFLDLLEEEPLSRLATPAVSQVVALTRAGLFRAAYGELLIVLDEKRGGAALQVLAGDLAARLGEWQLAVLHYREATHLNPQAGDAHAGLGRALLLQGDLRDALPALERAVVAAPDRADAWSNLGVALRRQGRHREAEEAYRRALSLDQGQADTWYNLGRLLTMLNRHEEAALALRRSLEQAPGDCDTLRALAQTASAEMALPAHCAGR